MSSNDVVISPNMFLMSVSDNPSPLSFLYSCNCENESSILREISSLSLSYSVLDMFKSMSAAIRSALPRLPTSLYWFPISRIRLAIDLSSGSISLALKPTFCAASLKYLRVFAKATSRDSVLIRSLYLAFMSFNREIRSCNMSRCSFCTFLPSFSNGLTPRANASCVAASLYCLNISRNVETSIVLPLTRGSLGPNSDLISSETLTVLVFLATPLKILLSASFHALAAFPALSPALIKSSTAPSSSIFFTTKLTPYFLLAKKLAI